MSISAETCLPGLFEVRDESAPNQVTKEHTYLHEKRANQAARLDGQTSPASAR